MATKKKAAKKAVRKKSTNQAGQQTPLAIVDRPENFPGMERMVFVDLSKSDLEENPDNWKTHSKRQLNALDSEFDTVGWVLPMAFNLTTGKLLDGHGRKKTEWVQENKIVPVILGHWTPEQEQQILLHLDPVGGMFETHGPKFRALMDKHRKATEETLDQAQLEHKDVIDKLNDDLESHAEAIEYGAPASFLPDFDIYGDSSQEATTAHDPEAAKDEINLEDTRTDLPGVAALKTWFEAPFDIFGPAGPYDIPLIRPDMLGDPPTEMQTWVGPETPEADAYFYVYGCAAIEKLRSNKLVVSTYTQDHKFESLWNDPRAFTARMLRFGINSVITPNYSIWHDCPLAFEIWQVYRSRWLGRYWQEAGLKVIPDIQLSNTDDENRFKIRMAGIPKGAPCVAIQAQQKGDAEREAYYALGKKRLLRVLKHLEPKKLLVYHGPDLPKYFLQDLPCEVIQVKAWMWERGKVLKEKDWLTDDK